MGLFDGYGCFSIEACDLWVLGGWGFAWIPSLLCLVCLLVSTCILCCFTLGLSLWCSCMKVWCFIVFTDVRLLHLVACFHCACVDLAWFKLVSLL